MDFLTLGLNVKRLRKAKGFSQGELGELSGLSQAAISLLERGHSAISLESLYRICVALNVPMGSLFEDQLPELEEDVSRIIDLAHRLTPSERKTAIRMLESYLDSKESAS